MTEPSGVYETLRQVGEHADYYGLVGATIDFVDDKGEGGLFAVDDVTVEYRPKKEDGDINEVLVFQRGYAQVCVALNDYRVHGLRVWRVKGGGQIRGIEEVEVHV